MGKDSKSKKTLKDKVRADVQRVDGYILERLYSEFAYVQSNQPIEIETFVIVHRKHLSDWLEEISQPQLMASLKRLNEKRYISSFEYLVGDGLDEYDFRDSLRIHFEPDFEDKFWRRDEKLKKECANQSIWAKAATTQNTLHLHVGTKPPAKKQKVHLIFDNTGEMRIDKKDTPPGELFEEIESTLTTHDGAKIHAIFKFEKGNKLL